MALCATFGLLKAWTSGLLAAPPLRSERFSPKVIYHSGVLVRQSHRKSLILFIPVSQSDDLVGHRVGSLWPVVYPRVSRCGIAHRSGFLFGT
jgi:hypothetical protein